ncbi:MAG: transposase [Bacteroidetes bacterium GWE2_40_15]|nr:MAG: transposase [Bacteroidetes bacterium GWE2_40_15]
MNQGKYVFSQIMDLVVRYQFDQCVKRYHGEKGGRVLTCWEQFLALSFGQLSFRKSLRDIVVCLSAHRDKAYHLGFRSVVCRSTLADANEHRDWRIYFDFANLLIKEARKFYTGVHLDSVDISDAVYVIDSTTIELCLSLFPWAKMKNQAAIKIHLGLELHGNIPAFFSLSDGRGADVKYLDDIEFEIGAYYVFDRGYYDFGRFHIIDLAQAYFVTRAKSNWSFRRLYSRPFDKKTGVRCDQVVVQNHNRHQKEYPEKMRRIKYYDEQNKRYYVFITNNFELKPEVVAELYKQRWQVELFFKWLKQHLAIEAFWGRSANAVKTQICVAISVYLLVSILKKHLRTDRNTYEILQILSVSLFDKIPVVELISKHRLQSLDKSNQKQAQLLEF